MDTLTTVDLWRIIENPFIRPRNITFVRYMLLTTKQSMGESIKRSFGKLRGLKENCELGNQEETLIRDLFIANMHDSEIQKELLKKTVDSAQALRLATYMEVGQRNQLQITNGRSTLKLNAIISQRQFRNSSQFSSTKLDSDSTVPKLRSHLVSESNLNTIVVTLGA